MSAYAMVVIVAAPDEGIAHDRLTRRLDEIDAPWVEFVGEPWSVKAINHADVVGLAHARATYDDPRLEAVDITPEYGTLEAFDQHP